MLGADLLPSHAGMHTRTHSSSRFSSGNLSGRGEDRIWRVGVGGADTCNKGKKKDEEKDQDLEGAKKERLDDGGKQRSG